MKLSRILLPVLAGAAFFFCGGGRLAAQNPVSPYWYRPNDLFNPPTGVTLNNVGHEYQLADQGYNNITSIQFQVVTTGTGTPAGSASYGIQVNGWSHQNNLTWTGTSACTMVEQIIFNNITWNGTSWIAQSVTYSSSYSGTAFNGTGGATTTSSGTTPAAFSNNQYLGITTNQPENSTWSGTGSLNLGTQLSWIMNASSGGVPVTYTFLLNTNPGSGPIQGPPSCTMTASPPATVYAGTSINWSASGTAQGSGSIQAIHFDLSTNGGATVPEAYVVGASATANGFPAGNAGTVYTMYATSEDNLGQWSAASPAASSAHTTVTVVTEPQTISFTNPGTQTYGVGPFGLSASATSGLGVTFSIASGPATVSGSTITITGAGSVTVNANQGGNVNWQAAPQVQQTFTVNPNTQTISFTNPGTQTYGVGPFGLSASATSGLGVTFSIASGPATVSGSTITITGAGTVVVNANQAGNSNWAAAAQVQQSFTVNQATQTISFTNPGTKTYGVAPFGLVASGGGSGNPIVFTIASGPASIVGSTLTVTGAGTVVVNANQAGNGNYSAAAQVQQSFVVNQAPQTVTISPTTQTVTTGGSITFTPGGGQNGYTWGGSSGATSATVNFPSSGTYTVTVQSPAGGNYALSNLASATITVVSPGNIVVSGPTNFGSVIPVTGSSSNTLTISNTGGTNFQITSASVTATYTITSINGAAPAYPITVPAGGSVPMVITFVPTVLGTSNGTLTINNTSANSPVSSTALTGMGAAGLISVTWP